MTQNTDMNTRDTNTSALSRQIEDWLDRKIDLAAADLHHWIAHDLSHHIQTRALAAKDRFNSLIATSPAELILEMELPDDASLSGPQLQEIKSQLFDKSCAMADAEQKIADIVAEGLESAAWIDFSASTSGDRSSAIVG